MSERCKHDWPYVGENACPECGRAYRAGLEAAAKWCEAQPTYLTPNGAAYAIRALASKTSEANVLGTEQSGLTNPASLETSTNTTVAPADDSEERAALYREAIVSLRNAYLAYTAWQTDGDEQTCLDWFKDELEDSPSILLRVPGAAHSQIGALREALELLSGVRKLAEHIKRSTQSGNWSAANTHACSLVHLLSGNLPPATGEGDRGWAAERRAVVEWLRCDDKDIDPHQAAICIEQGDHILRQRIALASRPNVAAEEPKSPRISDAGVAYRHLECSIADGHVVKHAPNCKHKDQDNPPSEAGVCKHKNLDDLRCCHKCGEYVPEREAGVCERCKGRGKVSKTYSDVCDDCGGAGTIDGDEP
jgi:hypothetical protein